ncbi:type VII secretion-associated serine protease mycosin [Streptomyces ziwulingensis]|uniref:Type VII secretion-associated serine protease mycosin n=1 Tax=Streptomyces ziwulingensis TaxID=1045501 RepID=A0ABP9CC41_9ACTN
MTGALLLTSASTASADYVRDGQWPLTVYDAEKVWETSRGADVTVAVVDSGVDASHVDLTGQVLPGKDFTGSDNPQQDNAGHGTGMASLIAGHGHGANGAAGVMGLAPESKILPVRVDTSENNVDTAALTAGIRYAVDQGASVINLSIGDSSAYPGSKAAEAIAYAQDHDVVVVAATGNDAGTVSYPAALPGVVAVSAVDQSLGFWGKSNTGNVTVAAPGVQTPQADPTSPSGYVKADGTSGSAAYVSAIVALLRSEYPNLSAGQTINRLIKAASFLENKGKKAPDSQLGYGIARPGSALTMDIPAGPKEGPLAKASTSTNSGAASDGDDSKTQAKKKSKSSSGGILVIAGIAAVVVVIAILFAVIRSRRNRGNRGGGPGSGGGTPGYPVGYPQQPPTGQQPYPYPPDAGQSQGYPTPPGQPPRHGQ